MAHNLQSLSPRHRVILRLYGGGLSNKEIAERVKCSQAFISYLVKQKIAQDFLEKVVEKEVEGEFKKLYVKVVKVIGDALDCQDAQIAMAGANLWLKTQGKFNHPQKVEKRDLTAEDIVQKIMSGELQSARLASRRPIELPGVIVSEEREEDPPLKH